MRKAEGTFLRAPGEQLRARTRTGVCHVQGPAAESRRMWSQGLRPTAGICGWTANSGRTKPSPKVFEMRAKSA